ncbi:MAG: hypothetical protein ABW203_08565 [Novosphingobium sp.]
MMFGPRLGTVFSSRWRALWWAAAVLFGAWCLIPSPDDASGPSPEDLAAVRRTLP